MSNCSVVFLAGVVLSVFTSTLVNVLDPSSDFNILRDAKANCEMNLPRTQKCVIVAVPEIKQ